MYKITVIIPTYNVEKYIQTCIDSIINQTIGFENIELIVVDDCSDDNTYSILKQYEEKYNNFFLFKTDCWVDSWNTILGKPSDFVIFRFGKKRILPHALSFSQRSITLFNRISFLVFSFPAKLANDKNRRNRSYDCLFPLFKSSFLPVFFFA